jgi:hypothetical protein
MGEEDTSLWLLRGDLRAETESEITATQDLALQPNCHATEILPTGTDSRCRLCRRFKETMDHIISARPMLAKERYIKRHDKVCARKCG